MSRILWIAAALLLLAGGAAQADEPAPPASFAVAITAPAAIEENPGLEKTLTVTVSNKTAASVQNLLIYVTMADVTRNLVVDLADFGATKVYTIDTLDPMKSITLQVPLKLAFTGDFYLYMTALAKDTGEVAFSRPIDVKIHGATAPSEGLVVIVSALVPGVLLLLLLWSIPLRVGLRQLGSAFQRAIWFRR